MNHYRWKAGVLVVAVAAGFAGCTAGDGGSVKVKQGDELLAVANVEEVLASAQGAWELALKESKEVYTTAKSSQCYLPLEQDAGALHAYCGPVSFLDGPQEAWNAVLLTTIPTDKKDVALAPAEAPVILEPVSPEVDSLRDAEGKKPSGESPPAPTPPAAKGDKAYGLPDGVDLDPVEEGAVLHVPETTFTLTGRGEVEEVSEFSEEYNTDRRIAPEGKKFFAFEVDGLLRDATVRVGSETYPVNQERFAVAGSPDDNIVLVYEVDGVTQELDLLTGERLSKGVAEDWYSGTELAASTREFSTSVNTPKGPARWEGTVEDVQVTPWTDELGWAEGGKKSWVIFTLGTTEWRSDGSWYGVINPSTDATLRDAEGNVYSSVQKDGSALAGDQRVIFQVPAGGTGYDLVFESSGWYSDFAGHQEPVKATTTVKIAGK